MELIHALMIDNYFMAVVCALISRFAYLVLKDKIKLLQTQLQKGKASGL